MSFFFIFGHQLFLSFLQASNYKHFQIAALKRKLDPYTVFMEVRHDSPLQYRLAESTI